MLCFSDLGLEAHFKFSNISELNIDVEIDFYDGNHNEQSESFAFEPKSLKIEVSV